MSKAGKQILDGLKDAVEGNFASVHIPVDGALQTWVRIDPKEEKVIPRSQYEALMAAAKAGIPFAIWGWCDAEIEGSECLLVRREDSGPITVGDWRALRKALASLRSAGIEIEDKTP